MQKGVVLAPGVFDLLHHSHLHFLFLAREVADTMEGSLIVALNTDASARALKGPERPVLPFDVRKQLLESLRCVDSVVELDDTTPVKLVLRMRPDVVVKGGDWGGKEIPEMDAVKQYGGRVLFLGEDFHDHTTDVIRRLREGPNEQR